jgi:hypothetical protein
VYPFTFDPADEIYTSKDIPPLVVPTKLETAPVFLKKTQVIVRLEKLIVKFEEREPKFAFKALPISLSADHLINPEMLADVA